MTDEKANAQSSLSLEPNQNMHTPTPAPAVVASIEADKVNSLFESVRVSKQPAPARDTPEVNQTGETSTVLRLPAEQTSTSKPVQPSNDVPRDSVETAEVHAGQNIAADSLQSDSLEKNIDNQSAETKVQAPATDTLQEEKAQ